MTVPKQGRRIKTPVPRRKRTPEPPSTKAALTRVFCDPEVEVTVSMAKLRFTCTYARTLLVSCLFVAVVVAVARLFVAVCAAVTLRSSRAGRQRDGEEEEQEL